MEIECERKTENIRKFWNSRAEFGHVSGSNDFIIKDIETKEIFNEIRPNSRILEVGCGNGETLIRLAKEKNCSGLGIDFSPDMISLANKNAKKAGVEDKVTFKIGQAPGIGKLGKFDYALSQRCLGNLTCVEDQRKTVENIMKNLESRGAYIMVEDCIQGHNKLNEIRKNMGMEPIGIYWFNLFFDANEVANWGSDDFFLESGPKSLGSTYYLLSRVIYAKLEHDKGTKPEDLKYDSDINMLAYKIPNIGDLGAPSLWIWRKK
jgi:cyclopropane fatty-acyl-phospholipid synthase-like methyltransferase